MFYGKLFMCKKNLLTLISSTVDHTQNKAKSCAKNIHDLTKEDTFPFYTESTHTNLLSDDRSADVIVSSYLLTAKVR